jgi:hypothetical protein
LILLAFEKKHSFEAGEKEREKVLLVQKSNKNKSKTRSVEIKITRKNCLRSVGHLRNGTEKKLKRKQKS